MYLLLKKKPYTNLNGIIASIANDTASRTHGPGGGILASNYGLMSTTFRVITLDHIWQRLVVKGNGHMMCLGWAINKLRGVVVGASPIGINRTPPQRSINDGSCFSINTSSPTADCHAQTGGTLSPNSPDHI